MNNINKLGIVPNHNYLNTIQKELKTKKKKIF